ncbi:uncharacterized protein LOC119770150 [Culex quinquefasciatus]|uniref:uncharacterized protein LOC119770150 n=1 Tax=Culex quinquefasciatus TaxID=7176 RepID=UPI0018E3649D|nr:uncharacterized protein LOC119770150 [Culex quinquefasciatus]
MLPFNLHPTLIWAIAFCCLCVTMYLCTFRSYLKGVKGPISQLASSMPLSNFTPKVRNSAVTIFVIDVEAAKMGQDHVLQGSPATLNMEAILKSQKVKPFDSASSELAQSDSLTNLLLCDEKSDSLRL